MVRCMRAAQSTSCCCTSLHRACPGFHVGSAYPAGLLAWCDAVGLVHMLAHTLDVAADGTAGGCSCASPAAVMLRQRLGCRQLICFYLVLCCGVWGLLLLSRQQHCLCRLQQHARPAQMLLYSCCLMHVLLCRCCLATSHWLPVCGQCCCDTAARVAHWQPLKLLLASLRFVAIVDTATWAVSSSSSYPYKHRTA